MTRIIPPAFIVLPFLMLSGCGLVGASRSGGLGNQPLSTVSDRPIPPLDASDSSDTLPHYEPLAALSGNITSIGDATTTNLAARAITEFRRIYPAVTHNATAGLTSIGAAALLLGTADIVPMSRPLTPAEIAPFQKKYGYAPTEIKVAA